jgi:hypothetical protein
MFVCPIPGADTQTVMWHALLHYGLAAIVVTVGVVFLGLAVIAYRADTLASRPESGAVPASRSAPTEP